MKKEIIEAIEIAISRLEDEFFDHPIEIDTLKKAKKEINRLLKENDDLKYQVGILKSDLENANQRVVESRTRNQHF